MNRIIWTKKKSVITLTLCAIIAVSSIMILQNNQTTQAAIINPHAGLVGWWRFDEGSGTVAKDQSENGNNGILRGSPLPSWVIGKNGQALQFDGVQNYVSFGSLSILPIGASARTINFWANGLANENTILVSWGTESSNALCAVGFRQNQKLGVFVWGANDLAVSLPLPYLNQWHMYTVTYNGSIRKIYQDGVLAGSDSSAVTLNTVGQTLFAGKRSGGEYCTDIIDEVQIYNRALSADEIQASFNYGLDFSTSVLAKVPQGTTQVITTLSWQGTGNINVTIQSPSQNYTENTLPEYQKTSYSTSSGTSTMLNIKRLSVSVNALSSDQNWNVVLTLANVDNYQISVEVQK